MEDVLTKTMYALATVLNKRTYDKENYDIEITY